MKKILFTMALILMVAAVAQAGEYKFVSADRMNRRDCIRGDDPTFVSMAITEDLSIIGNIDCNVVAVSDGITSPTEKTGFAILYVDSADGDFKIKFGDGTVKTIAADT